MKSIKPEKQRKMLYNAPLHKKRKWIASHLAENLLLKYDRRSIPLVKGDTVKVMRGSFKGHEDKVAQIHVKKQVVEVEGITIVKADGTKIAKAIHASDLLVTKMNLTDKWRRKKLERGLSEDAQKEIEKEAEQQLKEIEEERKAEELAKEKEQEELKEEPSEPEPVEEEKKLDKPKEKQPPKTLEPQKTKEPKQEKKEPTKKSTTKKPKSTSKKATEKKSTTKTTKKKEAKK
jgi:large subunit ribosomal protein L24